MKIGVIGSGIAGITASYLLGQQHEVTLFEKDHRIGGHTNTVAVTTAQGVDEIDTGFIVLNDRTYPTLHKFFKHLKVPVRYADMSFSYEDVERNFSYGSRDLNMLFAQRKNIFSFSFLSFLAEFPKFWKAAQDFLASDREESLATFCQRARLSERFRRYYLYAIGGAIWSAPRQAMEEFPARNYLSFFRNHGLLNYYDQPRWQTVVGGSHSYLKAFKAQEKVKIVTGCTVGEIKRHAEKVSLSVDGVFQEFDHLVIATHPDQALGLLTDADPLEIALLWPWRYQANQTVLHSDAKVMPTNPRAWACWNYLRRPDVTGQQPLFVSYWMNQLQGLVGRPNYFVSLNSPEVIAAPHYQTTYAHPCFTTQAVATQQDLRLLRNRRRTSFCGAYFGYGFHEDGCKAGAAVAKELGIDLEQLA